MAASKKRRHVTNFRLALITVTLIVAWLTTSTTQPDYGAPLRQVVPQRSAAVGAAPSARDPELLVMLAFSGGGTRAAALSYGVLQELARTTVTTGAGPRRLLDEVDIISSVSGGSFTNAYFGLFGDRIFDDFRDTMLLRPIQSDLLRELLNPRNWHALFSPFYGRSDMAAAYYDEHIFRGKTFADIRQDAPWIIINASELAYGKRMVFSQALFDLMCIDFAAYPVARAVAASSAVPGVATPIVLRNNSGQCGYQLPTWLKKLRDESEGSPLISAKLSTYVSRLPEGKQTWLHLVDGGVTDNLGLRQFYEFINLRNAFEHISTNLNADVIKDVLLISVNAAVEHPSPWTNTPRNPRDSAALGTMTHIQMSNHTADTLVLLRNTYDNWRREWAKKNVHAHFGFVEVAFSRLTDTDEQARMNALPTSLQLSESQVDALIAVGGHLLSESPQFRDFLARRQPQAKP